MLSQTGFTFSSIKKIAPSWSVGMFSFTLDMPYLFNSHFIWPSFLKDSLKLVEDVFLRRSWPNDSRLEESNLLEAYPTSSLSSSVLMYLERENMELSSWHKTAVAQLNMKKKTIFDAIINQNHLKVKFQPVKRVLLMQGFINKTSILR